MYLKFFLKICLTGVEYLWYPKFKFSNFNDIT